MPSIKTRQTQLYRETNAKIALAQAEYRERLKILQEECGKIGHKWKFHQVAGDGRYCEECTYDDPDFED